MPYESPAKRRKCQALPLCTDSVLVSDISTPYYAVTLPVSSQIEDLYYPQPLHTENLYQPQPSNECSTDSTVGYISGLHGVPDKHPLKSDMSLMLPSSTYTKKNRQRCIPEEANCKCPFCGKLFRRSSGYKLRSHMGMHNSERESKEPSQNIPITSTSEMPNPQPSAWDNHSYNEPHTLASYSNGGRNVASSWSQSFGQIPGLGSQFYCHGDIIPNRVGEPNSMTRIDHYGESIRAIRILILVKNIEPADLLSRLESELPSTLENLLKLTRRQVSST